MTSQDDYVKSSVRMPKDLHAILTKSAAENGRSLNAEILARLSETPVRDKLDSMHALLRKVVEIVKDR